MKRRGRERVCYICEEEEKEEEEEGDEKEERKRGVQVTTRTTTMDPSCPGRNFLRSLLGTSPRVEGGNKTNGNARR